MRGGAPSTGGSATGAAGSSAASGSGGASGAATGGGASGAASGNGGASGAASGSGGASGAASGGGGASGATSGGGASGASGNGGSGAATSSGCSQGMNTIFCEDFESTPAGMATATNGWSPVTSMGTLTIDETHARGKQALHVHTDGNGKAYIQVSPFAPPQNSFFGRVYAWVTAFPTAPDYAHFTLVEAAGSGAGVIRPIGGQFIPGKSVLWGTGSDGGPTGDWTNWRESAPAESGKWLCLEWEMNAADNNINVWIDGTAKTELSVSTKMHGGTDVDFVFPMFNSIWFGWWLYQSGPTPNQFDLWLDDIALGSQRLGCSG